MRDIWKEPAEIVGIAQEGVPVGMFGRTAPGFVLENGTALLESEKDTNGFYIGGAGMDRMYLSTLERYEPVRDDAGQLTGFRSMSKHVTAFRSEELIYSYALSPEEDLVKDLSAVRQRLGKVPEAQALYTSTIEKLEQVPPDERRRLAADVYATWKERHMQDLSGRQQAAQRLPMEAQLDGTASKLAESRPVGRIDYLAPDGTTTESIEYTDARSFVSEIEMSSFYYEDSPFAVTFYRDDNGKTIPRDFASILNIPHERISIADYTQTAKEKEAGQRSSIHTDKTDRPSMETQLDSAAKAAAQINADRAANGPKLLETRREI